jgi:restriction endonuclease Mrr
VAKPSSQVLAVWVKMEVLTNDWRRLEEVLVLAVSKHWTGHVQEEVLELVEDNWSYVAEHLREERANARADGAVVHFEIDDEPSPYLRATGAQYLPLLEKLRKIDPFQAEDVCARILRGFGGEADTTQQTVDGGIDFIAHGINIVPGALLVPQRSRAIVVGQTKRYKAGNAISETKLREFVGAATLRRHQLGREGRIGPLTPVIFAYWTTSDFEMNAKRYARDTGMWFMDGLTFATYASQFGLEAHIMGLPDV